MIFFMALPVYGWLYQIVNPYDKYSDKPAIIYEESGIFFMKYLSKNVYKIVQIRIIDHDCEAQTLTIKVGSDTHNVAILNQY